TRCARALGRRAADARGGRGPPHRPGAVAHGRSDRVSRRHPRDSSQYPHPQDEGVRAVRVEQALRLLPTLEALMPLRGLLLSSARPDERVQWGSGGPYLTVGKRDVEPGELARSMGSVLTGVAEHMRALYGAYIEALERQERNDAPGAVTALVGAGRLEEKAGRLSQAQAWYNVALSLAETLQARRPEVET